MKPVDLIHHMPDGWNCVLQKAFAHLTKFFGGDHELALNVLQRALVSGRIAAMVRPLTDISKGCVLPVEFWQEHKPSSVGPDHILVRSKEYPPMGYRYFLRQSDLEKVWPVSGGSKPSGGYEAGVERRVAAGEYGEATAPPRQRQVPKRLIQEEVKRRAAVGERWDSITGLSQDLREWMKTVSGVKPLAPRTIENYVRGDLWLLISKK